MKDFCMMLCNRIETIFLNHFLQNFKIKIFCQINDLQNTKVYGLFLMQTFLDLNINIDKLFNSVTKIHFKERFGDRRKMAEKFEVPEQLGM